MKIGLIDVDGHNFPNLCLMKISAWHKQMGDSVEWYIPLNKYDRVYMSKVFTFTKDYDMCINADEVIKGGTGYDLKVKLPDEIENIYPDYLLYKEDKAYGYLTRGCPRGCKFCVVAEKEGKCSKKVADLKQFLNNQKEIKLLDPNILASNECIELLQQLKRSRVWIDFTQGLDIRLMTEEKADLIKQLKIKMIHFAWDTREDEDIIIRNLSEFKKNTNFSYRKLGVYILTNFDTSHDYDLYRVYKLKSMGYNPYVMIYDKDNAPRETRLLQRWVNNKIIFRSGEAETFEQYNSILG